jgi:hypothetical protein
VLDAKGFIKTGPDLSGDELTAAHWPLPRAPHLLETSVPRVFAIVCLRPLLPTAPPGARRPDSRLGPRHSSPP